MGVAYAERPQASISACCRANSQIRETGAGELSGNAFVAQRNDLDLAHGHRVVLYEQSHALEQCKGDGQLRVGMPDLAATLEQAFGEPPHHVASEPRGAFPEPLVGASLTRRSNPLQLLVCATHRAHPIDPSTLDRRWIEVGSKLNRGWRDGPRSRNRNPVQDSGGPPGRCQWEDANRAPRRGCPRGRLTLVRRGASQIDQDHSRTTPHPMECRMKLECSAPIRLRRRLHRCFGPTAEMPLIFPRG